MAPPDPERPGDDLMVGRVVLAVLGLTVLVVLMGWLALHSPA